MSAPLSTLNATELETLAGHYYSEFDNCSTITVALFLSTQQFCSSLTSVGWMGVNVQVSCVPDILNPDQFYRSIQLDGCTNVAVGSPTADTDQVRWDDWLERWKSAFYYALIGLGVETAWDMVEYLAYVCL